MAKSLTNQWAVVSQNLRPRGILYILLSGHPLNATSLQRKAGYVSRRSVQLHLQFPEYHSSNCREHGQRKMGN